MRLLQLRGGCPGAWTPLLVLLGAIVSYLVAWALSWYGMPRLSGVLPIDAAQFIQDERMLPSNTISGLQPLATWRGTGVTEQVLFPVDWSRWGNDFMTVDAICSSLQGLLTARDDDPVRERSYRQAHIEQWDPERPAPVMRVRAGWPLRCVEGWGPASTVREVAFQETVPNTLGSPGAMLRLRTIDTRQVVRLLPWSPLWLGLAVDAVLYAFVLWLLFAGPFVVRRWRRIRRGLCPKCAYDLRGTPKDATGCPECGAALTQ